MKEFEGTKKLLDDSNIYYLIAVNMESNYSYVNKRYQKIFNSIHGDLVGQHYAVTMHPDDTEVCRQVSELAFMNPTKVFPATIRKHDGKGGFVITQWEYKALFDEQQQPVGIFCIGHDITEFTQNSNDLQNVKASLRKTEFTLAQITYIQSHVVRKPIANIMGLSMLLETMEIDPAVKDIFNMINDSAKELDKLIRNMAKQA